jgi:undecaprenyl-diphosphatase
MGGIKINLSQVILLGIIQGLTEFLPVSSSGHLVFFQSLFGMKEPQIFFDVMLHLGTLLAVVVFFRTDIWKIAQGLGAILKKRHKNSPQVKLFLLIIIATLPTGLMGILFKGWFESLFSKPKVVGGMLLITGSVLWFTRWTKKEGRPLEHMRWLDAILIGIAQGVAIIPGISRSGATISTGLFLGLDRELSGKFSFLLSIPAILGATLLEFRKMDAGQELWATLIGTFIAFGIGILSLLFLMKIIKVGKVFSFSYYCWSLGIIMIIFSL